MFFVLRADSKLPTQVQVTIDSTEEKGVDNSTVCSNVFGLGSYQCI